MKQIFYYIFAGVVMLTTASCAKEVGTPIKSDQMTIIASLDNEDDTKAILVGDDVIGYNTLWQEGDKIKIYCNEDGKTYVYTLAEGAGTRVGRFTGDKLPKGGDYIATYGEGFSCTSAAYLSNEQNLILDSEASNIPMTANVNYNSYYDITTIANFKSATGLLRLSLHGTSAIKNIKITTDQYIAGTSTISSSDGSVVVNQSGSGIYKYVTLNCDTSVDINFETKDFCIALPAGEYTGLKIEFTDTYGFVVTKTLNAGKKLNIYRAKINPVELTVNFPTGKSKAIIDGKEVYVQWFQLWENGPRFAEYNLGVTDGKAESTGNKYSMDKGDPATKNWGNNWRTPREDEMVSTLQKNCTYEFTTLNGVEGLRISGKGAYSKYHIFLPRYGAWYDRQEADKEAYYWTSSSQNGYYQWALKFSPTFFWNSSWGNNYGFPIRPVVK